MGRPVPCTVVAFRRVRPGWVEIDYSIPNVSTPSLAEAEQIAHRMLRNGADEVTVTRRYRSRPWERVAAYSREGDLILGARKED